MLFVQTTFVAVIQSILQGYKDKTLYLATQMPLPNTINNVWRMVYDYKSTIIVMLNDMNEDDNVSVSVWQF